jgi:A/G-specific adenine glycosylase
MSSAAPFFTTALLDWYLPERRPLPWKHITDPYQIWLSEIILQQTRAAQGAPYFERFRQHFPSVADLAEAPTDELMKLWEGLGYYSRARNLHAAAQYIHRELGGQFPDTHAGLLALPGVGPYTAAAIASFAFKLPYAVVDGNVYRVLSRYLNSALPVDSTEGKRFFADQAQRLLGTAPPDRFNQAMMDLGAMVCTPKSPDCGGCPLSDRCQALEQGTVGERPVKGKKMQRRERHFNFLVLAAGGHSVIEKRLDKDIWHQLYQFPLLETDAFVEDLPALLAHPGWPQWLPSGEATLIRRVGPHKQELTHQRIIASFWELELPGAPPDTLPDNFTLTKPKNWRNFAFPRVINWYIGAQEK